jgi:hypothetical protein
MACHWDLVGVTEPWDPDAPKHALKTVKKPVIDVDDVEDAGDEAPSLAVDIVSSSFALQNAANVLVTESAAVWATFIQFQDTLAGSLDRLTGFLVKEQAEAQENHQASFRLLERIMETVERSSPRRAGVVPTEGSAAGGTDAVPVVERVRTLLFMMDSDPMDLPFAVEADKDSEKDSGHGNKGRRNKDKESRSEDGDAMVE